MGQEVVVSVNTWEALLAVNKEYKQSLEDHRTLAGEMQERIAKLEHELAVERDWTKHLVTDLDLLQKTTDPKKYEEAATIVGRLTYLEAKNVKLTTAIESVIEEFQDRLADCDPSPSPRNGTARNLERRIEWLKETIKW